MKLKGLVMNGGKCMVLGISGLFLLNACGNKNANNTNAVKEYAVIEVQPTNTELASTYPATIRGKQDVEIRPQVSGFITKLCVDEGAVVRKGQTLFIVDPTQYESAVQTATAAVNVAKSNVNTQELTVTNKRELNRKNIISDFDLQTAENQLATAKASLAQAEAQLVSARQNLSFTQVSSPSDGVIGTIPYRIGSLVSPSIATPLTTVSEISEMYVYFSMTEKQLLEMTRKDSSLDEQIKNMPPVQLRLSDGSVYAEPGRIEMVSGVIDQSTGAVSMRAAFPNKNHILRSGGTGSIILPSQLNGVIIIPQKSTYELQDKKFVYVVGNDSKVKNTQIEVFNIDDGKSYVVTSGLNAGDKIVYEGAGTLRDGVEIKPITPEEAAAKMQKMTQPATPQK